MLVFLFLRNLTKANTQRKKMPGGPHFKVLILIHTSECNKHPNTSPLGLMSHKGRPGFGVTGGDHT